MTALLEVDRVDAGYGAVPVLWDVSFEVGPGEVVALIGANGAGKSTVLRVLSGLLTPWRGRVRFQGRDITGLAPERIVGLGLAHVPQGRRLFPELSVRENLLLGAYARSDRQRIAADLGHVLELFPVLGERLDLAASQLSGGEQQMAALGRALMASPRLLLIDEPSLGLAPLAVQTLMDVVDRLHREGVSVLLVEQDVLLALGHADRGYVLDTGRVSLAGTAAALVDNARVRTAYLGLGPAPATTAP
jgi:branched-chain amino acid transport system ATP-binding protein